MNKQYFITAIGTDSGKTLVSAIFAEALQATYWKPVQAGFPTDSETIKKLLPTESLQILPEHCVLNTPASPHAAAEIDNVNLRVEDFQLPNNVGNLIIEGAGGIMVPLNQEETVGDLMKHFDLPIILVSNLYLGNINHTLLSFQYLLKLGVKIKGLVFNGISNPASEQVIESMTGLPVLLRVKQEDFITKSVVKKYADLLVENNHLDL